MNDRRPQFVGIEVRETSQGARYRARKARVNGGGWTPPGPWRSSVAAARADRTRLLARRDAGQFDPGQLPTLREAAELWLAKAERGEAWARGRKPFAPKTLRGYRQDFDNYILDALGDVAVDRVRRSSIQGLVDDVAALCSGQKSRNVATAIMSLYRWLLGRYDDLSDPTVGLDLPQGSRPRDLIVTPPELTALVDALAPADRAVLATAGMAGLRHGELRALVVGDVVLDAPTYADGADVRACARIEVRAGWDAVEGRRAVKHRDVGEGRDVPILAPLRPYLEAQLDSLGPYAADPTYPVFPGTGAKGSRVGRGIPADLSALLVRARKRWADAGLAALGLHDARHTFASHLIVAGVDVATVAEWIGHAQPSTTLDRYVKPLRQRGVKPADARAYLGLQHA